MRYLLVFLLACHSHEHEKPKEDERPTQSATKFSEKNELFVEYPALVVGMPSKFAVHVTRLGDFKPEAEAPVAVKLGSGEEARADRPRIPGIYGPVLTPQKAGKTTLAISVGEDRVELGAVVVAADATQVPAEETDSKPTVPYLKEQQWSQPFATEEVKKRPFRPVVAANGQLSPRPEGDARVTAPVAGRLTVDGGRFPRLGDNVQQDQVLAVLAPRLSADADVASLRFAVRQAELELEGARKERERVERLLESDAVPERRVVEAKLKEQTAQAALQSATARLGQFEGTQRARAGQGATHIALRSPIAGTIVTAEIAPGSFVREGDEIFRVVSLDRIWLEVRVPEAEAGRLIASSGGSFTVEGYPGAFSLSTPRAKRIALGGMVNERTRTVPLVFEIDNPDRALRVGMLARVYLAVGEETPKLVVPRQAVVTDQGASVVFVLVDGEHFARRRVTLGASAGEQIEIRAGLEEGERIVTVGADEVRLAANAGGVPAHGHEH